MANKFNELLLYIAESSKDDPTFGAIKLNKILFMSDFFAFGRYGKSITDVRYIHRRMGPTAQPMVPAVRSLVEQGRAHEITSDYYGHQQKRLVPLCGADMSAFTGNEISTVNETMALLRGKNGKELSEITHDMLPWLLTKDGEEIPYYTIFSLWKQPVGDRGMEWAAKEINAREAGHSNVN